MWFAYPRWCKKNFQMETQDQVLLLQEGGVMSRKAEWWERHHIFPPKLKGDRGKQNVALFYPRLSKYLSVFHVLWLDLPSWSAKPPGPGQGIPTASSSENVWEVLAYEMAESWCSGSVKHSRERCSLREEINSNQLHAALTFWDLSFKMFSFFSSPFDVLYGIWLETTLGKL